MVSGAVAKDPSNDGTSTPKHFLGGFTFCASPNKLPRASLPPNAGAPAQHHYPLPLPQLQKLLVVSCLGCICCCLACLLLLSIILVVVGDDLRKPTK